MTKDVVTRRFHPARDATEKIDGIRRRLARLERSLGASHRHNLPTPDYARATPHSHDGATNRKRKVNAWQYLLATPLDLKSADQMLYGLMCDIINTSGTTVLNTCETYFRTVQKWLPVISKHRTYRRVTSSEQRPQADFALLVLCIHLVTLLPSEDLEDNQQQESEYMSAKCIQAQLLSFVPISVEIVQSCLLIAMYEYARGNFQSAYLSMGTCMRAASALGLPEKGIRNLTTEINNWTRAEEQYSLWWGCVILDRLIRLEGLAKGLHLPAQYQTPIDELPLESRQWDVLEGSVPSYRRASLAEGPSKQVKGFGRAAQCCHLLGKVLDLVSTPAGIISDQIQDISKLDSTLQSFLCIVLELSADPWDSYCTAIGAILCALFRLHSWTVDQATSSSPKSILALEAMSKVVLEMGRTFTEKKDNFSLEGVPPVSLHMFFQAAQVYICVNKKDNTEDQEQWLEDIEVFRLCLWCGSKRWRSSSKSNLGSNGRLAIK
ncbi:hypothetical protein B7463_g3170, partial [Scytalidium lignicola]